MNKLRRNILSEFSADSRGGTFKACSHCKLCLYDFCDALGCPCYPIIQRLEQITNGKSTLRFAAELILKYGSDKAVDEIFREIITLCEYGR